MSERPAGQLVHEPADVASRVPHGSVRLADPLCRRAQQAEALRRSLMRKAIALCSLLAVAVVILAAARLTLRRLESSVAGRAYPRVYALGVSLGGLTASDARLFLAARAESMEPGAVTLRDGERRWSFPGRELGVHYDVDSVVQAAMAVGRSGSWAARLAAWLRREEVGALWAVDVQVGRAALAGLPAQVDAPPREATLYLQGGQLVAVSGQPGRALEVDATLEAVGAAVRSRGDGSVEVALRLRPLPPQVTDARPALPQAEAMLQRSLTLTAYDATTNEILSWVLDPTTVASWLRVVRCDASASLRVQAAPEAIRATLARLAGGLSGGRGLRLDEATAQVLSTLAAGGGRVSLYLTHPEHTHIVERGDTLQRIATGYGLPLGLVVAANPGLDPDRLSVGQALVIPSVDVLLPHLAVSSKRIVISIGEQRLRAYEQGKLRWDWPCSTGLSASPTLTGTFQVLKKEQTVHSELWGLTMPHFLALYPSGEGHEGIHGPPVTSSGTQLWAARLGQPASLGSVVLGTEQAEELYAWAEVGVPVIVE